MNEERQFDTKLSELFSSLSLQLKRLPTKLELEEVYGKPVNEFDFFAILLKRVQDRASNTGTSGLTHKSVRNRLGKQFLSRRK